MPAKPRFPRAPKHPIICSLPSPGVRPAAPPPERPVHSSPMRKGNLHLQLHGRPPPSTKGSEDARATPGVASNPPRPTGMAAMDAGAAGAPPGAANATDPPVAFGATLRAISGHHGVGLDNVPTPTCSMMIGEDILCVGSTGDGLSSGILSPQTRQFSTVSTLPGACEVVDEMSQREADPWMTIVAPRMDGAGLLEAPRETGSTNSQSSLASSCPSSSGGLASVHLSTQAGIACLPPLHENVPAKIVADGHQEHASKSVWATETYSSMAESSYVS